MTLNDILSFTFNTYLHHHIVNFIVLVTIEAQDTMNNKKCKYVFFC